MAALCKYWAFAFILCQLGQQHMLLNSLGSMGSFFLLGLGALLLLINSGRVFDRKTVSSSPFIYSFVFIFILYQFTFGIFDLNEKTGIYLIAKVVCCLMIAFRPEGPAILFTAPHADSGGRHQPAHPSRLCSQQRYF